MPHSRKPSGCSPCDKKCPERKGFVIRQDGEEEIKLFFYAKGKFTKNTPVVLFVHGRGTDHRIWGCQQKQFCECLPTLSIDLRGFGRSTKSMLSTYSFEMFREDILAVLHELEIKSVVYVGTDIGASIGIDLATSPAGSLVVEQLVLVGANPLFTAETRNPAILPGPTAWEYATYTTDELTAVHTLIKDDYDEYLIQQANGLFSDRCCNIYKLKAYSFQVSKQVPSEVTNRILGYNNPNSFVYESLFGEFVLDKLNVMSIPILIVIGQDSSALVRGASLYIAQRLVLANALVYEFLKRGVYVPGSDVEKFACVLANFIVLDDCEDKCDICPIPLKCPCPYDE